MNELIEDLKRTNLFSGIEPQEIDGLLHCLCARYVRYVKGDRIIEEGNKVYDFGIMLSGHGRAIKWDSSDRIIIITLLKKGSEIKSKRKEIKTMNNNKGKTLWITRTAVFIALLVVLQAATASLGNTIITGLL